MNKKLFNLLSKRFGDRFMKNLNQNYEIDYSNPRFIKKPENKCTDCKATDYRQDLPFWLGSIPKKYMLIAQDAGKGKEPEDGKVDFNTVFSLLAILPIDGTETGLGAYIYNHKTNRPIIKNLRYLRYFSALILGKDIMVDGNVSKERVKLIMESCYFTDVVKCAFSSMNNYNLKDCPCHRDVIEEIKIVSPEVVFLFGTKSFNALQNAGLNFYEQKTLELKINETQVRYIKTFKTNPCDGKTYILVPQLGNNRFSNEGFESMIQKILQSDLIHK